MRKHILYTAVPTIIFAIILVLITWDNINTGITSVIGFDEAYNAQVAKHFAETGKYAVTYPDEIVFYNSITTGPTMLLGTAFLYKVWGISNFTTNFIPIIYGAGTLILLYILFAQVLQTKCKYILSIVAVLLYLGVPGWFELISVCLIGEIGAMFYALLSTLFLLLYYRKSSIKYLTLSGFFLAFSLVTKSSQICYVIVFCAMIVWNELIKKGPLKKLLYFLMGLTAGILVWEIFKLVQYGGDVSKWLHWWVSEKNNLFSQTGTTSLFGNFTWAGILDRALYLKEVLGVNYWLIVLAIAIPLICFVYYYFFRKRTGRDPRMSGLLAMALGAESLLIYFVLFGSEGLKYARRMAVYGEFLKIMLIIFFMISVEKVFLSGFKNVIAWLGIILLFLCLVSEKDSLRYHWWLYTTKNSDVSAANRPIQEMRDEIMNLPSDAQIYVYGWWQAPEVGLLVEYNFKDINPKIHNGENLEEVPNYFLIGGSLALPNEWEGSCAEWLGQ